MLALHHFANLVASPHNPPGHARIAYRLMDIPVAVVKPEIAADGVAPVVHEELAFKSRILVVHQFKGGQPFQGLSLEILAANRPLVVILGRDH